MGKSLSRFSVPLLPNSQLIGIGHEHIAFDSEGISIHIPFSKTDQSGQGHHVEIPKRADSINCPIAALEDWLKSSGINKGAIFKPITKHGVILDQRLSGKSIALIVKRHAGSLFEDSSIIAGH